MIQLIKGWNEKIRDLKIRTKFFLTIFLLIFLCILVQGFFYYWTTSDVLVENSRSQLEEALRNKAEYLAYRLSDVTNQFNLLSINPQFEGLRVRNDVESFVSTANLFTQSRSQNEQMVKSITYYRADGKTFYEFYNSIISFDEIQRNPGYQKAISNNHYIVWYNNPDADEVFLMREIEGAPDGVLMYSLQKSFFCP